MKTSGISLAFCGLFLVIPALLCAQQVVTSPAGGEIFAPGSTKVISWDTKLVTGMVSLSLWDGAKGKWSTIWNNVPSEEGKISWVVPSYLEGTKFRVKLSTTGTVSGSALTKTFFTIKQPTSIARVESAGDQKMIRATVHPNPASGIAHICVEELPGGVAAVVEVVDEMGNKVVTLYDGVPSGDLGLCMSLDCSRLASGTYYAQVQNAVMGRAVKIQVIR